MIETQLIRAAVILAAGLLACPVSAESVASGDARVARTAYQATGQIPCSMGDGQPTGSCAFRVTREGNGSGVVTVTKPDALPGPFSSTAARQSAPT